jgi:hypothetical protein
VFDLGRLDHPLLVIGHVPQVPGGDGVLRGAVSTHLNGEEMVCLILALELGCELSLWNSLTCWLLTSGIELIHF